MNPTPPPSPATFDDALAQLGASLDALGRALVALKDASLPQPKDRALSLVEVARLMSRDVRSVYRAIDSGELVARKIGADRVVLLSDFHAYLRGLLPAHPRRVRRARALRGLVEGASS